VLSYFNLELAQRRFGNLVLCAAPDVPVRWRTHDLHRLAVALAPSHYHWARLHRGALCGPGSSAMPTSSYSIPVTTTSTANRLGSPSAPGRSKPQRRSECQERDRLPQLRKAMIPRAIWSLGTTDASLSTPPVVLFRSGASLRRLVEIDEQRAELCEAPRTESLLP